MDNTAGGEYTYRKPEGMWGKVFSDHPFTPILDRAEGIYLYDTDGKKYIDVSGSESWIFRTNSRNSAAIVDGDLPAAISLSPS